MISKAGPTSDYPCQKALWTIWMTLPARWKQIYTSSHQWTARIFMKPVPDAATQTSKTFKKPVKLKVNRQQMQFVSKWYHVFSGYATLWCAIVPKFACLCKLSRNYIYIYNIYIYTDTSVFVLIPQDPNFEFQGPLTMPESSHHWPCLPVHDQWRSPAHDCWEKHWIYHVVIFHVATENLNF